MNRGQTKTGFACKRFLVDFDQPPSCGGDFQVTALTNSHVTVQPMKPERGAVDFKSRKLFVRYLDRGGHKRCGVMCTDAARDPQLRRHSDHFR
jgi:hypothetical protein